MAKHLFPIDPSLITNQQILQYDSSVGMLKEGPAWAQGDNQETINIQLLKSNIIILNILINSGICSQKDMDNIKELADSYIENVKSGLTDIDSELQDLVLERALNLSKDMKDCIRRL